MTEASEEIRIRLSDAVHEGDAEEAEAVTRQALEEGVDPLDLIRRVIVPTLTEVGTRFQKFEIFLPELMMAGDAARRSTALLEQAIADAGGKTAYLGTVVIGTVEGDVHDIGKNILGSLLNAHGFKTVDLGRDVSPSMFLKAAARENANIVAMSALMTTTRPAQRRTIALFEEVGERDKYRIIVGGGSVDQAWADQIGADGYAEEAASAAALCKELLGED